jgi:uncharacterized protein involved in tolerance to divalent cations
MKRVEIKSEGGSIYDFQGRVKKWAEHAIPIETKTDSWEEIRDGINKEMSEKNNIDQLEADYLLGYLRIFDDGVVMLYL